MRVSKSALTFKLYLILRRKTLSTSLEYLLLLYMLRFEEIVLL